MEKQLSKSLKEEIKNKTFLLKKTNKTKVRLKCKNLLLKSNLQKWKNIRKSSLRKLWKLIEITVKIKKVKNSKNNVFPIKMEENSFLKQICENQCQLPSKDLMAIIFKSTKNQAIDVKWQYKTWKKYLRKLNLKNLKFSKRKLFRNLIRKLKVSNMMTNSHISTMFYQSENNSKNRRKIKFDIFWKNVPLNSSLVIKVKKIHNQKSLKV